MQQRTSSRLTAVAQRPARPAGPALPAHPRVSHPTRALLLGLQRSAGNAAVAGVLRAIGDGHDLTSPRFAGDERLEACFDDQARLTKGATGDSVVKVQQALIDLGHDVGPTGADGIYGDRTWNAVRGFKAEQALGFEHMGDVGPGTMRRLNELFPAEDPVPPPRPSDGPDPSLDTPSEPGEEVGPESCPATDDIVTALEAQPQAAADSPVLASALGFGEAQERAPAAPGVPGVPGAGHVDIPTAVRRFKEKVNVTGVSEGLNLTQRGQFFWSRHLSIAVEAELGRIGQAQGTAAFVAKARRAFDAIMDFKPRTAAPLLAELHREASASTSPEKPAMLAVLHAGEGRAPFLIESALFTALNASPTNTMPSLVAIRSLGALLTVRMWDKSSCGFHAHKIAARLRSKGGITGQPATGPGFTAHLAGTVAVRDRRPVPPPDGKLLFGDRIFQSSVSSAVSQLKRVLDAGHVVHARVLSGVGYGLGCVEPVRNGSQTLLRQPPPEEHSLLIIGFDGDRFVFNDPDATVSHTPEPGFGVLFHDPIGDRLSTARDPLDLLVTTCGEHIRGDKRYQVISLATL